MPGVSSRDVLRHLNTLFHCGTTGQQSDAELLERFAAGRGEIAEAAFAALMERHGKMVLGVCQRVLGNHQAAEDAFQATFLVLARKAASIAHREQLANWLYGVALRAALEARGRAARRKAREKRYSSMLPVEMPDPSVSSDVRVVLDEELARLPERYRAALVLCELEGLSRRQAAAQLGISEGTLSSRLARAKIQLKDRLTLRGVALSAAALGAILAQDAVAVVVSPTLVESTIELAGLLSSGSSLAGIVSTPVATLTEGVLKAMLFAKVKSVFLGIATLALVTTGIGVLAQTGPASPDDRLKAVERKLDKLLEVLGGAKRAATVPAAPAEGLAPTAPTAPADPTEGNQPPPPPRPPAALPTPAVSAAAAGPSEPAPMVSLSAPNPAPVVAPPPPSQRSGSAARSRPGQSESLAGRIQTVEHRLDEFERRLAAIERRLQQNPGSVSAFPGKTPSPDSAPAPASAPSAGAATRLPLLTSGDSLPDLPSNASSGNPASLPSSDGGHALSVPSGSPAPPPPDTTQPPLPLSDQPSSDAPR